ncbi:hypothetical protein LJR042_000854 [Microbacterium maritypicum]|nr:MULTISPECIES: hypothetical protein [Microbacterium]
MKPRLAGVAAAFLLLVVRDVLIDTRYTNLAPTGYTSSIVEHIFG